MTPPKSIDQLLGVAQGLAGLTLGELATQLSIQIPPNFKKHKGWSGQLLELALGAEAGSKPQQDFAELGVELKSIPIDRLGMPLETTYVCYAHLIGLQGITWETSSVRNKLSKILWVPVEGMRDVAPEHRRIASPFLWQPTPQQEQLLRSDWEELMEMITTGKIQQLTARHGQALHIRPKAANGSALTPAIGDQGQLIQTRPRGYYLRKDFTADLIRQAFGIY